MKYSLLCLGVLAVSGQETAPTIPGTKGKAGYTTEEGLGGPSAVPHQLVENDLKKTSKFRFPAIDESLEDWFDWKKELNDNHGFQLGMDYSTLFQSVNESLGEDSAGSGIFRLFAKWTLHGRGTDTPGN